MTEQEWKELAGTIAKGEWRRLKRPEIEDIIAKGAKRVEEANDREDKKNATLAVTFELVGAMALMLATYIDDVETGSM